MTWPLTVLILGLVWWLPVMVALLVLLARTKQDEDVVAKAIALRMKDLG